MPSSISSSESLRSAGRRADGPLRAIPAAPWPRVLVASLILFLLATAGWELYWRSQWFQPSYRNSDGLWTLNRNRLDRDGPGGTAVIGSSRVLFDINLEAWRDETGTLPVQLALEGTGPRPFLSDIARNSEFAGLLVVGVTPVLFFTGAGDFRVAALEHRRTETWAEWSGQQLSMRLLEPFLAFDDFDTALFTVLRRQPIWPVRPGLPPGVPEVRKLSNMRVTRQADMWDRVELDPDYRELSRNVWLAFLDAPRPDPPPPDVLSKMLDELFAEVAADVDAIRARGGEVVFVRAPSAGPFREAEAGGFPRERFWDELLRRTDAVGVHFEDHPDLQDVELPEWSHIRAGDTDRFTRALIAHLRDEFERRGTLQREIAP